MMRDFTHYNVHTIDEATGLLKEQKGKAKVNAGGTDLLGVLKDMITPAYPESIINIKGIAGLDYIREDKEGLKIGALTKLSSMADAPVIKEKYAVLAEAAKSVATPQIRNMCTIGGNLAQDVRCWYYRYPDELGGAVMCLRKGGAVCNALVGDNRYHSIFGTAPLTSYPCASHCPAGTAIPFYIDKIKNGSYDEAAGIFADYNPLPAITGRVCPTFCEPECKRGELDEPVAIRCVERSLGDYMLENASRVYTAPGTESGKKAAVIGSGPAGLAAAYYLRRAGHAVTVFERLPEAGGMLSYSIPGYRLPKEVVRKQVEALRTMGITFKTGCDVGKDISAEELAAGFDAVVTATGAWTEKAQSIKGDAPILSGLQFLKKVNEGDCRVPGKKVAVVGGGNVAIDVARTLTRLGAKAVIIYRRSLKEMPAFEDEVKKAVEEGVGFKFLTLPTEAVRVGNKVSLTCIKMKLGAPDTTGRRRPVPKAGSESTTLFDAIIRATGEEPDLGMLPASMKKKVSGKNSGHLLGKNIYMAGDFMNGSSTVIEAVASGREASRQIDGILSGNATTAQKTRRTGELAPTGYEPASRITLSELSVAERLKTLDREDAIPVAASEVVGEANRCFNCGCVAVNPSDIGVALVAVGGKIVTTKRRIDAGEFFAPDATMPTVLDEDEIITEIQIPHLPAGSRQLYSKFTIRKPVDFAVASVASVLTVDQGVCTDARIVLGAVAPGPVRAQTAEKVLIGRPITAEGAEEAAQAALAEAKPLSKNAYKVQIARTLIKRAIMGEHV